MTDLRGDVDTDFTEIRGELDTTGAGQRQPAGWAERAVAMVASSAARMGRWPVLPTW
jgi:hypothetical protein